MDDNGVLVTGVGADKIPGVVPRRPLDQMRIVAAAVEFIDTFGLGKLTMRRLGAHLGVEAMALYRYVPGREHLLDEVVDMVMDELHQATAAGGLSTSWQEYLQLQAHTVRAVALAHPKIFPLVATRPPEAPWLRPPLRSLHWVESFLQGLRSYGFSSKASVAVYRSFATFLLGALLLESGTLEDLTVAEDTAPVVVDPDALAAYPIIAEMADELRDGGFEVEFEAALEDLIERVDTLRD